MIGSIQRAKRPNRPIAPISPAPRTAAVGATAALPVGDEVGAEELAALESWVDVRTLVGVMFMRRLVTVEFEGLVPAVPAVPAVPVPYRYVVLFACTVDPVAVETGEYVRVCRAVARVGSAETMTPGGCGIVVTGTR